MGGVTDRDHCWISAGDIRPFGTGYVPAYQQIKPEPVSFHMESDRVPIRLSHQETRALADPGVVALAYRLADDAPPSMQLVNGCTTSARQTIASPTGRTTTTPPSTSAGSGDIRFGSVGAACRALPAELID